MKHFTRGSSPYRQHYYNFGGLHIRPLLRRREGGGSRKTPKCRQTIPLVSKFRGSSLSPVLSIIRYASSNWTLPMGKKFATRTEGINKSLVCIHHIWKHPIVQAGRQGPGLSLGPLYCSVIRLASRQSIGPTSGEAGAVPFCLCCPDTRSESVLLESSCLCIGAAYS